jgi:hypothetical protein
LGCHQSFFNFGGIITGLVPTQNALTVHTTDGIYTHKISQHLDGGYWPQLNPDRIVNAFAEYFPRENEVWFFVPYGLSQTNMNHIIKFNRVTRRWYGPDLGFERNCSALIDGKVHAGDFGGFLLDHDSTNNSDEVTSSIAAAVETGAPPAIAHDVKVRWLTARHMYDGKGIYLLNVLQQGAEFSGQPQSLNLAGTGFTLDSDTLDLTTLAEIKQLSQDLPLVGYAPQSSIQLSMASEGQTFAHRKIFLRYKPLGRFTKELPSD